MGDEIKNNNKSLLLAPNYVKDVQVAFGNKYTTYGSTRQKVTIEMEIDPNEADYLRRMPGMDDQQFVAFLMPCIQTSIYKTIEQGMNNTNMVEIVEEPEDTDY